MIYVGAAQRKYCLHASALLVACGCLLAFLSPSVRAQQLPATQQPANSTASQQAVIERIEFVGNRRIQRETLMARIFSRQGDPYSPEAVRRDFRALWNTQFFEDIRLEVENSPDNPNGKILVFYVQERPTIRNINYKGNKSVSESDILDAFKDRKVDLVR